VREQIATPGKTREIIKNYGIRVSKKLGQNFLADGNIVSKMIESAELKKDDLVIEIGPGIGALTQQILQKITAGYLFAIEKDHLLIDVLRDLFSHDDNLELICEDILNIDWQNFFNQKGLEGRGVKVLASLPYYITTPIIMGLLESGVRFSRLILMVQKEVAERMAATSGQKDYGALSIAVQYYSRIKVVHIVPPTVFIPKPGVYSSIVLLEPYVQLPVRVLDQKFFFAIVRAIFQQRRKNIKNALSRAAGINLTKETVLETLTFLGIDQNIRGEKLEIEEIANLSNQLWKRV
jgi:16S rRNA (adenine1518-N6/adenine1519-N6)-dimethyltransferase